MFIIDIFQEGICEIPVQRHLEEIIILRILLAMSRAILGKVYCRVAN